VGAQTFTAQALSAPPASISATATAQPAGKSLTEVNLDHTSGDSGVPGPAVSARIGEPHGMAVASDGTLYFADPSKHRVRVVRPDGTIEDLAGGPAGFSGDYGPAKDAKLYWPYDVALDEPNKLLYIADTANNRIRLVDLSKAVPTIQPYAGGGSAPVPGYGDGGLATAAALNSPSRVAIGPDKALYIVDKDHHRIRRVDPTSKVIATLLKAASCSGARTAGLAGCSTGCALAWDSKGSLFISGALCGTAPGSASGIVRRAADGSLHHVAGKSGGVTTDGAEARSTALAPINLAFDSAGNLLFAEPAKHRIRRIDGRTGLVSTVAGTGTAGVAAEFSDATSAPLDSPAEVAFDGPDLLISDSGNYSIRRVAGADVTTPTAVTLAVASGDNQTIGPAQLVPLPLSAKLTVAGSPLPGVVLWWSGGEPAVGLTSSTASTAADGLAMISPRPGIAADDYKVDAAFFDIHGDHVQGSPLTYTLHAVAPSAGTIFTAVNVNGLNGVKNVPGASTLAQVDGPRGLVVASDGTIYLSTADHQVFKISKRGEQTHFASAGAGFMGDSGPALQAKLYWPAGLALDETRNRLYIADHSNNRVRMVDLATDIITTYTGGGPIGAPSYGDGAPADQGQLLDPFHLALDASGVLYIGDNGHHRIREVDPTTKLITTLIKPSSCSGSIALASCTIGTGCGLVTSASGGVFVSGGICGTLANAASPSTQGILHVTAAGVATHIAGKSGGATTDGTAASNYDFADASGLARSGTDLYVVQGHRVMKLSTSGGNVTTLAGATSGFGGDYGPASAALLATPLGLAVIPGPHLLIADSGNRMVRMVW